MYYAHLDDGREVIVDTSRQQTRTVTRRSGEGLTTGEFFLDPAYVNVLLYGRWHTVKKARLKKAEFGNPFGGLRP